MAGWWRHYCQCLLAHLFDWWWHEIIWKILAWEATNVCAEDKIFARRRSEFSETIWNPVIERYSLGFLICHLYSGNINEYKPNLSKDKQFVRVCITLFFCRFELFIDLFDLFVYVFMYIYFFLLTDRHLELNLNYIDHFNLLLQVYAIF
jgi:hypothetical protein